MEGGEGGDLAAAAELPSGGVPGRPRSALGGSGSAGFAIRSAMGSPAPRPTAEEALQRDLGEYAEGLVTAQGLAAWIPVLREAGLNSVGGWLNEPGGRVESRPQEIEDADVEEEERARLHEELLQLAEKVSDAADSLGDRPIPPDGDEAFWAGIKRITRCFRAGESRLPDVVQASMERARGSAGRQGRVGFADERGGGSPLVTVSESGGSVGGSSLVTIRPEPRRAAHFSQLDVDELRDNLASTCNSTGVQMGRCPLVSSVEKLWRAAQGAKPELGSYDSTKWALESTNTRLIAKGAAPAEIALQLQEFDLAIDTLTTAYSFDSTDPKFGHYEYEEADTISAIGGDRVSCAADWMTMWSYKLDVREACEAVDRDGRKLHSRATIHAYLREAWAELVDGLYDAPAQKPRTLTRAIGVLRMLCVGSGCSRSCR